MTALTLLSVVKVDEGGATTRRMSGSSLDCAPSAQGNNITPTTMAFNGLRKVSAINVRTASV